MNIERVCALWFSPAGGTEQIARFVVWTIARQWGISIKAMDFTILEHRNRAYRLGAEDLLVMASPVYVGRLPNKLMPQYKAKILGNDTPAVPICVFGSRSCDEALRELVLLLEESGFHIAGAAFAGRHVFSTGWGRGILTGATGRRWPILLPRLRRS